MDVVVLQTFQYLAEMRLAIDVRSTTKRQLEAGAMHVRSTTSCSTSCCGSRIIFARLRHTLLGEPH